MALHTTAFAAAAAAVLMFRPSVLSILYLSMQVVQLIFYKKWKEKKKGKERTRRYVQPPCPSSLSLYHFLPPRQADARKKICRVF